MISSRGIVTTKRVKKSFFGQNYMLGVIFEDIYSTKSGSNSKEFKVSYIAYENLSIGDKVLCPMIETSNGLEFDYSMALEKI